MKLDGSISAVVTGGASRSRQGDRHGAARAGRDGYAIFDVNTENGERVAKELGATYCEVNVMDEASVDAGFAKARAANGQERCLVNCAGGGRGGKTIGRDKKTGEIVPFKIADFEYVLGLNTVGTFRCIVKSAAGMAALDPLEGGERGAIVNARVGRGGRRADRAGGLFGGEGGNQGHDADHRARSLTRGHPHQHDPARHHGDAADAGREGPAPQIFENLAASVPFPQRLGDPSEYADLALTMPGTAISTGKRCASTARSGCRRGRSGAGVEAGGDFAVDHDERVEAAARGPSRFRSRWCA